MKQEGNRAIKRKFEKITDLADEVEQKENRIIAHELCEVIDLTNEAAGPRTHKVLRSHERIEIDLTSN